jgi:hypothetical protein
MPKPKSKVKYKAENYKAYTPLLSQQVKYLYNIRISKPIVEMGLHTPHAHAPVPTFFVASQFYNCSLPHKETHFCST